MVHIEPMTENDHAEVSELLHACYRWLAAREGFTDRQLAFLIDERSSVQALRVESKTRPHLVARQDGVIAGMVAVRENEVARLYVHPHYHRQGVGKALFAAGEAMIREAGFTQITVAALVESAVAFYKAMGMSVTGRQPYKPEIFGGHDVVLMAKDA